jgi:3-phosphoshikimate 1-carboxyvinyltransferase
VNVSVPGAMQLRGEIRTPGDKSISHRAVLLSALASGSSTIRGASNGHDVLATIGIIEQLGADVQRDGGELHVEGPANGLSPSTSPLDCVNSGTTMRLLCGALGAVTGTHTLIGDSSLSKRPMDRVATPLIQLGMNVTGATSQVLAPLTVSRDVGRLHAIEYIVPVASSQIKSAVLLAALNADGPSRVTESTRTRANTEEMLVACGVELTTTELSEGRVITIQPGRPNAHDWDVPGDPSQAAFFVVLALISSNAEVTLAHLYPGVERNGFVGVLERMGASLTRRMENGALYLDVRSSELHSTTVEASEIPSVDEVPILAVAAAAAEGTTRFRNVGELRIKESDRFAGTLELITALGARATSEGDDLVIVGLGAARKFHPVNFEGALDHRMIMSAAVAASAGNGGVLNNVASVASSYPDFFSDLASLR